MTEEHGKNEQIRCGTSAGSITSLVSSLEEKIFIASDEVVETCGVERDMVDGRVTRVDVSNKKRA